MLHTWMRSIDNYVGKPICYFLGCYAWIKQLLIKEKEKPVRTILFAKYLGMGSIVHATPLLRAVKKKHPKAKIIFLTFHENKSFIQALNLVDQTVSIKTGSFLQFIITIASSLYTLRKENIDIVLNLEFFSKFGMIMSFLCGARQSVCYYLNEPWKSALTSHKVNYNHYKHISEIFMALGASIGAGSDDLALEKPFLPSADSKYIQALFSEQGFTDKHWKVIVNINTSALFSNRCWPMEYFKDLVIKMVSKLDARIILIGAPGDAELVQAFMSGLGNIQNVTNFSGKTNVSQLLVLMEQVDLVITNDSGPLHLAVLMGAKTISFFGPECPVQYGPMGKEHTFFYKGYYCSPCLHVYNDKNSQCENNICLKDISVDEVFTAVAQYHKNWKDTHHVKN